MLIPTIIMFILMLVLLFIAFKKGNHEHIIGLKLGLKLIYQAFPLLICALLAAGLIQVLLPQDLLTKWVGVESGMKGVLLGTFAGGLTPGGPYVSLPIVAGLLNSGASIGTMVAFLTSWSLWAIARLPMEFGILGFRFTLIRLASVIVFPFIAGIFAQQISKFIK